MLLHPNICAVLRYTKVVPIRASALPDYVFPDDRRPERKKKKKKKKKAAVAEVADGGVLSPPSPSAGAGEAAESEGFTTATEGIGAAAPAGDVAGGEAGTDEAKERDAEAPAAEASAKRKFEDLDDNELELDEAAPVAKVLKLNTVSTSGGPKLKL